MGDIVVTSNIYLHTVYIKSTSDTSILLDYTTAGKLHVHFTAGLLSRPIEMVCQGSCLGFDGTLPPCSCSSGDLKKGCQVMHLTRNVGISCDIMPTTSTSDVTEDEDSNDTIITQNENDSRDDLSKSLFSSQDVNVTYQSLTTMYNSLKVQMNQMYLMISHHKLFSLSEYCSS